MRIGDEVFIHGYIDEIRNDIVIIHNDGGYFGTVQSEIVFANAPALTSKQQWIPCSERLPEEGINK